MKALENRLPPPLVVAMIAVAMVGASRALPPLPIAAAARVAGAAAIAVFGFSFIARAFRTFRRAGTTIDPVHIERASALVTSGVFGRSRNPMYVGMAVMLVGWAVLLGSPWLLVGPALFVAFTTRFQILPEERAMRARFGDAYSSYVDRVRRWL